MEETCNSNELWSIFSQLNVILSSCQLQFLSQSIICFSLKSYFSITCRCSKIKEIRAPFLLSVLSPISALPWNTKREPSEEVRELDSLRLVEFLNNYLFLVVFFPEVASLHSSVRFLKVVCLSCSKLELHLPDDFHIRLLASTLHFLRLLELDKNNFTDIPKKTDSYLENENDDYQSRTTEMVLVEQEKASWSDDVVEQGYCLVVSLLEGCEPVLLPELLDGLCDEIVSCLMHPCKLLILGHSSCTY